MLAVALVTFESDEVTSQRVRFASNSAAWPIFPDSARQSSGERDSEEILKELKEELNRKVSTTAYEAVLDHEDIRVYQFLKWTPAKWRPIPRHGGSYRRRRT